jgi:hypothetical protein
MPHASTCVPSAVLALLLAAPCAAGNAESALAHVPPQAISFVVVPDLARAGADLSETLARMNRPETSVLGKPVEQLKGWLGVGEGFDERGSIVAYSTVIADAKADEPQAAWTLLLPASDPKALAASLGMGADGALTFMGQPAFAALGASHVIVSQTAALATGHDAQGGSAASFMKLVGDDLRVRVDEAEVLAWAGPVALGHAKAMGEQAATIAEQRAAEQGMPTDGFAGRRDDLQRLSSAFVGSIEHGIVLVDIDALGLALRPIAVLAPEGALAKALTAGEAGPAPFSLLPKAALYGALSIDVRAVGGGVAFKALAAAIDPAGAVLPAWLIDAADLVDGVQLGAYPSKLGVMAGGLLNDSSLVVVTKDPAAVQGVFKDRLMQMGGVAGGLKLTPTWEDARTLKDGTTAAAFELKPEPVADDGQAREAAAGAMLATQAIFGNRGMHGFARAGSGGLVVTYSQRPDVLTRATDAQAGRGATLADDAVVKSMMQWMVAKPDVVGFLGLGQLLKAARQIAGSFGGGADMLPPVPSRAEPIGVALDVRGGRIEGAVVVPTAVLAAMAEYAADRGPAADGDAGAPTPADGESAP